jgi:hypothetical protein
MQNTCKSCGHAFEGTYCNQCGEKVYREEDKSILHREMVDHVATVHVPIRVSLSVQASHRASSAS